MTKFRSALAGSIALSGLMVAAPPAFAEGEATCACSASVDKTAFEKDRAAILAMAGEYEVDFQFQETVGIVPGYELKDPYYSGATEFVEVVEDTGERIVLQHILVMSNSEDAEAEPYVIKHWRQDWVFQDTSLIEFRGHRIFETVELSAEDVAGTWTQAVYQVDDSPRYEAVGRWSHLGDRSSWESGQTWRPLPRREHTKRSDYHVMVARNRHTITPTGWVHEQDNQKLVLDEAGNPLQVIAHESGLNVYDRVDGHDFSAGYAYWEDTKAYWNDVRAMWLEVIGEQPGPTHVATKIDDELVYAKLFKLANQVREEGAYGDAHRQAARAVILASIGSPTGQ
ncbi:MAG: DUF6607 family protein [Planctomycetota bacterium]